VGSLLARVFKKSSNRTFFDAHEQVTGFTFVQRCSSLIQHRVSRILSCLAVNSTFNDNDEALIMTSPIVVALLVYALGAVISFGTALLIKAIYMVVRIGKTNGSV
jgi:hypothetical protein